MMGLKIDPDSYPPCPPQPQYELASVPARLQRIEQKLDLLLAALAAEDEDAAEGQAVHSLDGPRTFAARDARRGL